jgi:diguanylate cyclase (GGDEF)-like protein
VHNEQGELVNYVAVFSNVGQLLEREQAMKHMANHDILTGLPNRVLLGDRLELALANAERLGESLAVCFLDLDGFKPVNDFFGHAAGDEVLKILSQRLKGLLRSNDTVARFGGDEFVILVGALHHPEDYRTFLDRVLATINQPIEVAGGVVQVSASIGVSLFPDNGTHAAELLQHADEAMYQAKRAGKSRYQLY